MIVRRLPDSELYHHGIKGQEWGDRNGPPYPLDSQTSAAVKKSAKKKNFIERARDKHKMKKVRKARVEKMKVQQREKEERVKKLQQANAERRERAEVIKTGSAKDIQKFQHKMSAKEYEEALARVNFKQRLDDAAAIQASAKAEKIQARLTNVMNTARTIGNVAQSAADVYSSLERMGIIKQKEKKEKRSALDRLRDERDRMNLELDISDLKLQKKDMDRALKESKNGKSDQDNLAALKRDVEISKAYADIEKNRRIIDGEDLKQKQVSGIKLEDLINELDRRGL